MMYGSSLLHFQATYHADHEEGTGDVDRSVAADVQCCNGYKVKQCMVNETRE